MQPITTKLSLKNAIPPAYGPAVPQLYLGMPPLEVLGVRNATTVDIRGVGVGGVTITPKQTSTKGIRQHSVAVPNGIRKAKSTNKSPKSTLSATNKQRRTVSSGIRKTTSKSTSKVRVISLKNGRKVYMKNGKFIKKGG